MKTHQDPRHLARIKVMQELFSYQFSRENLPQLEITKKIIKNLKKIDKYIVSSAPTWPINKINRMDLAVLRLAVYELTLKKDVPTKVVIDEAVELAKEYGSEASASFINGALGKLIIDHHIYTT